MSCDEANPGWIDGSEVNPGWIDQAESWTYDGAWLKQSNNVVNAPRAMVAWNNLLTPGMVEVDMAVVAVVVVAAAVVVAVVAVMVTSVVAIAVVAATAVAACR